MARSALKSHYDAPDDAETQCRQYLAAARQAARDVPGIEEATPRAVQRIGIVGAGTMGGGIAMAFVNAGFATVIVDTSDAALERGLGSIERNYASAVRRGSISEADKARRIALLEGTTDFDALSACDLIVEAAFEDMAVKKDIFGRLGAIAKPGAVLATNTSYLDVDAIAQASGRAQDVIGLHFFSPANVMKLLEVVRAAKTAPDVVATALTVGEKIGKVAVVVGVCHGFVGNRMLAARNLANEPMLLAGASPADIDAAFTAFGWPMGPFQMGDVAGLDISWRNRKALGKTAVIADSICEAGNFGQKTGSGWYRYEPGSRAPLPNPFVEELLATTRSNLKIQGRAIGAEEIIDRTLLPMINEGVKILEEGIVERASDIDLVWTNGYGFPAAKGGPMWLADLIGLPAVVEKLERLDSAASEPMRISPLLKRLAVEGKPLSAWRK